MTTNRRTRCSFLALTLAASGLLTASGQQLSPVWEYLINKPGSPVPVLTNAVTDTTDSDNGDGHYTMDSLGSLERYDANRLLLGIRENGIDESAPGANVALANQYPDRSLIWINPTNGSPMGVALNIGLYPVPLDADFLAEAASQGAGATNQYWWTFTVGEDGAIYTGYKNKILRYPSDGKGGISPTPTVVFTLTQADLASQSIDAGQWATWRWARLHVTGTGAKTVILAGSSNGTRGNWRLATTDGTSFTAGSFLGVGGATSTPVPSRDPATPDDEWGYAGIYPGNSNGADSSYGRYTAGPPFADRYVGDSSFRAPGDPFTYLEKYRADFIGGLDAQKDLDYLVIYSTPSWNSRAVVGKLRPGWLALTKQDGRFLSSHKLDITEDAELLSADQASLFQGTVGFVRLNKLADGSVEVLWSGTIYGYGRYLITPYGPEPQVPDGSKPPGPYPVNTAAAANWIASGGTTFDTTVGVGLEGQGPIPWSMSRWNRGDFAVRLSPFDPVAVQANFGAPSEFPGTGLGDLPEEQAWRPSDQAGIIIPTARVNGPIDWNDGVGGFYPVIAAGTGGSSGAGYSMVDGSFGKGDVDIQTGKAGDQSSNPSPEGNFNFASSWFPYAQGWIGGAVANPDASGNPQWESPNAHSAGLETTVISWPSVGGAVGGTAILSLPGVNALNDGMVFATSTQGASDVNIVSAAPKADGSGWVFSVRKASQSDPAVLAGGLAQFQFVYVPYNAAKLIGGSVSASGAAIKGQGDFTVSRSGAGTYNVTIPGKAGTNGVLLLQNASFLTGTTDIADNNFLSYQYQEPSTGTNGTFVIQARHTGPGGTFPLTDTSFYFAWVDFTDPLTPPAPAAPTTAPKLGIILSGSTATLTWSSSANGFTLETASSLSGSPVAWTSLGTVGQGALATSYTVPAGSQTQFYRLRK